MGFVANTLPISLKTIFDTWPRFSRGFRHEAARAIQAGLNDHFDLSEQNAWTYNAATDTIANPLNTATLVGFYSPEHYSEYLLDVTLKSSSNIQTDPVGILLARAVDPDGTVHTLTMMRCSYCPPPGSNNGLHSFFFTDAPMVVQVDYNTTAYVPIAKGYFGLAYSTGKIPTEADPYLIPPGGWMGSAAEAFNRYPNGVRIRATRKNDVITVQTSQYNDVKLHPGAELIIDLNSHPSLARFKGASSIGVCTVSQDNVTWQATLTKYMLGTPFWLSLVHKTYGTAGWMTAAAQAAGLWVENKVDLKEVFNTWKRISRGNSHHIDIRNAARYSDNAVPGDLAFYYTQSDNTIGNDVDTTSMVGFVSPDSWEDYLLDVIIRSKSDWQNDPVGLVLAYATDPDGTTHTLSVFRRMWHGYNGANAPLTVEVDHLTIGEIFIKRIYAGLNYAVMIPTASNCIAPGDSPWSPWPWNRAPLGVRIRVQRSKDEFNIVTSQYNSNTLFMPSQFTLDLNSHPALARFKGAKQYGFCCHSQDRTYWNAIFRPGGWRRAFWMSAFGTQNDYQPLVLGNFDHSVSMVGNGTYNYAPAVHRPTGIPLSGIVPLRTFSSERNGYVASKDLYICGHHFRSSELAELGLTPSDAIVLQRPAKLTVTFTTNGNATVGFYRFDRNELFENIFGMYAYESGATVERTVVVDLPQITEDELIVPYVLSDGPVSNITFRITNT